MPSTITGGTNDGTCSSDFGSWDSVRASGGANVSNITLTRDANALRFIYATRRGTHRLYRAFFEFDTSSISVTPTEATLKIHGHGGITLLDCIVVGSNQHPTLVAADFNNLEGSGTAPTAATQLAASDGSGAGTLASVPGLTYSAAFTGWDNGDTNEIDLNASALHAIEVLDTFKVCIMEYDHDYLDIDGGTSSTIGMYFADMADPAFNPVIVYEPGTAAVTDNATFFGANF
jgi:hypothetical protein